MADVFTKKKRSDVMSRIRAKNTKPELLVRHFLFSKGLRYRLHQVNLPGKPDIILKKYCTVIFVNGCFWHGHEGCKSFKMPKSRQHYWVPKIERNIFKYQADKRRLRKLGWKVLTVWECQLKKTKIDRTLSTLVNKILK
jgi:DNA mismatch endonuclease (patch repair protein)